MTLVVAVAFSLLTGGCANESRAAGPAGLKLRTIEITMNEMSYSPDRLTVRVGETVTFRIHNAGTVRHEAVFGDQAAQDAAMAMMQQMDASSPALTTTPAASIPAQSPGRSVGHPSAVAHPGMGLPNVLSLDAGDTGEITFQFALPSTFLIQCHEKGHLEMGMAATLEILPA